MKSKYILCGIAMAVVLQLGMLAASAQTNIYLYSGSETNITLNPGTYIITAYGAPGGSGPSGITGGASMSAEFNFSTSTNLTLLVGGVASRST
jgi:streptogramin lyase